MPNVRTNKKIIMTTPAEQALLFYGEKGTGKSEVIEQCATDLGMKYVVFFLGEMQDAGDLIGLMIPDSKSGRSIHLTPDWFPEGNEPVLFHLDEINRAKPELFGSINNLVLRRELNGKRLPEGSRIIATINPPDDTGKYDVEEMDSALTSRFNIYPWILEYEDWREWARGTGFVHSLVVEFLDKNPDLLSADQSIVSKKDKSGTTKEWKTADARAWVRVSDWMKKNEGVESSDIQFFTLVVSGIVGSIVANRFVSYIRDNKRGIDVRDILHAKNANELKKQIEMVKRMNVQELSVVNSSFQHWFEDNYKSLLGTDAEVKANRIAICKNLKVYLDAVPKDVRFEFLNRGLNGDIDKCLWFRPIVASIGNIANELLEISEAKKS